MASGKSVSKSGIVVKTEASYSDVYVFCLLLYYLMHISLHLASVTQKYMLLNHCFFVVMGVNCKEFFYIAGCKLAIK